MGFAKEKASAGGAKLDIYSSIEKHKRPFKNVKRVPKKEARAKNKLARAARRKNR